jgi:DNA-binding NtrC family response regulator
MAYSILIVDDEALTLRTIGRALDGEGFEVFLANNGEEALKSISEELPDLALVDVVLPGIDGIEVLRQAKKSSPGTIVIMMSAYHLVERAVEAMKLGAYDYLIKPFHVSDMVNTVRRATEMLAFRVRVHDTVQSAKGRYDFGRVVTQGPAMRHVLEMARQRSGERSHHHPDPGRERHRQGGAGEGHSLQQCTSASPDGQPELCSPARHFAGKRTVRLRTRGLHRRPPT